MYYTGWDVPPTALCVRPLALSAIIAIHLLTSCVPCVQRARSVSGSFSMCKYWIDWLNYFGGENVRRSSVWQGSMLAIVKSERRLFLSSKWVDRKKELKKKELRETVAFGIWKKRSGGEHGLSPSCCSDLWRLLERDWKMSGCDLSSWPLIARHVSLADSEGRWTHLLDTHAVFCMSFVWCVILGLANYESASFIIWSWGRKNPFAHFQYAFYVVVLCQHMQHAK